jgi:hypothetical protein
VKPWYGDLYALAEEAAKIRGVTLTQGFEVIALDDDAYDKELRRREEPAFDEQFHVLDVMLHPGRKPRLLSRGPEGSGIDATILAAYFSNDRQLLIRRTLPKSLAEAGDQAILRAVAHEVGHVVQDQRGLPMQYLSGDSIDQSLVRSALLEGDADLTATLLGAARQHEVPARAVAQHRYATRSEGRERETFDHQHLTPALRDVMRFRYVTAGQFIDDVYLAGGLSLVDQVMAHPPARSEAVADAQRWLHGSGGRLARGDKPTLHVGPITMRAFIDQWASTRVTVGTLQKDAALIGDGVLHACEDDQLSVEDDNTVVWKTLWASKYTPTADSMRVLAGAFDLDLHQVAIAQSGSVVVLVSGGDLMKRQEVADAAARTAREDAELPPFGARDVPDLDRVRAYRRVGPPVVKDGIWTLADLGLSLTVEARVNTGNLGSWFAISTLDAFLFIRVSEQELVPSDAVLDEFYRGMGETIFHGRTTVDPGAKKRTWQPRDLGWTKALEVREVHGQIVTHARNISLCHNHASLQMVGFGDGEAGTARMEAWLDHLKGSAEQPLCSQP